MAQIRARVVELRDRHGLDWEVIRNRLGLKGSAPLDLYREGRPDLPVGVRGKRRAPASPRQMLGAGL